MGNILEESLYKKQRQQFERIEELAKAFAANYCGSTIIRDSVFRIVSTMRESVIFLWKSFDTLLKMMSCGHLPL